MIFKKLTIVNFRQFLGRQSFDFSMDKNRRVTLIHAENGVGKTTFLNSIYWCLYGKILPKTFDDENSLVNDVLRTSDGLNECSVELIFVHEGDEFRVVRTWDESKKESEVQGYLLQGPNSTPVDGVDQVIERIMPRKMGRYFLMPGETLQELGRADSENFRDAVRTILGFDHAEKVREILESIVSKWNRETSKANRLDAKLSAALQTKGEVAPQIKEIDDKLSENRANEGNVKEALADINQELGKISSDDVDKLNDERNRLDQLIRVTLPRNLESVRNARSELLQKYGYSIFGYSFLSEAKEALEEFAKDRKIPTHYKDVFIKDLLEKALCICGTDLSEGSDERAKVNALYEGATTKEQEEHIDKAKAAANQLEDLAEEYSNRLQELITQETKLEAALASRKREKDSVETSLKNIDHAAKDKLLSDRDEMEKLEKNLRAEEIKLNARRRDLVRDLESAESDIKKGGAFTELDVLKDRETYVGKLLETLKGIVAEEDESAIEDVQKLLNEKLDAYSRKDYSGKVDKNYAFTLLKSTGTPIDKSTGESKLLSIAFVSSLIELAKNRSTEESDYFVKGTVAPFAIDAPFTALDTSYRSAVATLLPECADQFILLISSGDWQETVIEPLTPKIGKQYLLVANVAEEKGGRETFDEILINGNVYKHTEYGAQNSFTSSMEIV